MNFPFRIFEIFIRAITEAKYAYKPVYFPFKYKGESPLRFEVLWKIRAPASAHYQQEILHVLRFLWGGADGEIEIQIMPCY